MKHDNRRCDEEEKLVLLFDRNKREKKEISLYLVYFYLGRTSYRHSLVQSLEYRKRKHTYIELESSPNGYYDINWFYVHVNRPNVFTVCHWKIIHYEDNSFFSLSLSLTMRKKQIIYISITFRMREYSFRSSNHKKNTYMHT